MGGELQRLRRQLTWLKRCTGLLTIAMLTLAVAAFLPEDRSEVIRTRGIVIKDSLGNARILLGAPIPNVAGRVRTDSARVREAWAHRYPDPDEYMRNYKKLQHSTNGMLILGQDGFDRLAVGAPTPDPNIGPRIAPADGINIYGRRGFERSGYGLLRFPDSYRVVLGMDTNEGEGLSVALDGLTGERSFNVYEGDTRVFMGKVPAQDSILGEGEPFYGFLLQRDDSVTARLSGAGVSTQELPDR